MKLIFRGDPIELERGGALSRQSITLEGVTFVMNEARDASAISPRLLAKLRGNAHFEIVAEDDFAAAPAETPSAEIAAAVDDQEAAEAAAHAKRAAAKAAAKVNKA
jgi:hypothetical protein